MVVVYSSLALFSFMHCFFAPIIDDPFYVQCFSFGTQLVDFTQAFYSYFPDDPFHILPHVLVFLIWCICITSYWLLTKYYLVFILFRPFLSSLTTYFFSELSFYYRVLQLISLQNIDHSAFPLNTVCLFYQSLRLYLFVPLSHPSFIFHALLVKASSTLLVLFSFCFQNNGSSYYSIFTLCLSSFTTHVTNLSRVWVNYPFKRFLIPFL